jgi:hypothetical protein
MDRGNSNSVLNLPDVTIPGRDRLPAFSLLFRSIFEIIFNENVRMPIAPSRTAHLAEVVAFIECARFGSAALGSANVAGPLAR